MTKKKKRSFGKSSAKVEETPVEVAEEVVEETPEVLDTQTQRMVDKIMSNRPEVSYADALDMVRRAQSTPQTGMLDS